jgi:cytochrome c oxidase cbb3-type subunit 4
MTMIFSIWTVVVAILFIGIVIWVWSGRNKQKYEDAARIPLEDDDDVASDQSGEEVNNG